jgi:hypothetical protein
MKVVNILEQGGVVDLRKHKQHVAAKKRDEDQQRVYQALLDIDHAISNTVGHLVRQGMSEYEANRAVVDHLSDIVLAYDMMGGATDV